MAELVGEALHEAVVDLANEGPFSYQGRRRGGSAANGSSTAAGVAATEGMLPADQIPPPMVPDNADSGPSTCFLQVRMVTINCLSVSGA